MGSKTRHRRSRRTATTFFQVQSRGYSAHIGQEVEVHYRWHALYGRPVRRYYSEKRAGPLSPSVPTNPTTPCRAGVVA
jgi:hypothetical protein